MQFLADESCDHLIVRTLRGADHDVQSIAEDNPGISDKEVAEIAVKQDRVLITEDRDFGHFVFSDSIRQIGVIYLRYPFDLRIQIVSQLQKLIEQKADELFGKFIVVQPGTHRIRKLP